MCRAQRWRDNRRAAEREMARQSTHAGQAQGKSAGPRLAAAVACPDGVAPAFRFRLDPKCRSINGRGLTGLVVVGGA